MHSERKLKVTGLLRLFTAYKCVLTVGGIIASFRGITTDKQDSSYIEYFPYCDMDTKISYVSELFRATGM